MINFFIDRPVFAWVIAIVIMLSGYIAILILPVEQYPRIAPPTVKITTSYPGASAKTIENSITQIIEQSLTGIDYLRYFSSTSDSTGNVTITLTFEPEANPDIAQVQVQNKLQAVLSLLPQETQKQGISVTTGTTGFLMVVAFYSPDNSMTEYALGDYINSHIVDSISRVPGVGSLMVFGQPYAMRIWLDPQKLNSFNLSISEVQSAVTAQNVDVSAGQLGGMPAVTNQQINATITAQSRFQSVEDFETIILRVNKDGSQVRLKDVARIELGIQNYDIIARYQGKPASGMAITLASGANALETAKLVKEQLQELSKFMPNQITIAYPYDTTPFVKLSIKEVIKTLIEATTLVFLVMYLFLQNFRATLIPIIIIPIVLLGTFGVLAIFGFSINTLTMFAMVLAIGLLVDDAIVVIENVERTINETGLSPKDATRKSMEQITGALVGIALVLSAVFVPMAFFGGSSGVIYRQFSLTIVSSMTISVIMALIFSPSLCATILKPIDHNNESKQTGFFSWFNQNFNHGRKMYSSISRRIIGHRKIHFMFIYFLIIICTIILFFRIPTSFLPDEDQGVMFVQVATPPGATLERTLESLKQVENYLLNEEKEVVDGLFSIVGFSFAGRGQNSAMGFVRLKDWSKRLNKGQDVFALSKRTMITLLRLKDAMVFAIYPPAVTELGNASGFDFQLLDRAGLGYEALIDARNKLLGLAMQNHQLVGVRLNGLTDVPQYKIEIDAEKASIFGLSITEINNTLQTAWGSSYINDFLYEGRIRRVFMQGDIPYRMQPNNINDWYVRNNEGGMVSFSSFSTGKWSYGPTQLQRYNGISSQNIQGAAAPGISSGTAMAIMEQLAAHLPKGIGFEWSGLSYEELKTGSKILLLYFFSLMIVFLCLAALYESWSIPFAVIMVVPLGIFGTVLATYLRNLSNDVYFQVGMLTTIGLSAKNAILIVEFAKDLYENGTNLIEATMIAAEQRLRAILMTSMAFVLGVMPLAMSHGAGSGSQNAIGVGVVGGMISATLLAIFFVPMFFILIEERFRKKLK